jgi:hypothetical protein
MIFKEAHSVSFENFYPVIFYGNQIIQETLVQAPKSWAGKVFRIVKP